MTLKKKALFAGAGALIVLSSWLIFRSPGSKAALQESSALYTGKEPKRRVKVYFPSTEKPGFGTQDFEIYATASKSAQAKQVLDHLFKKPESPSLGRAFPEGSAWRELFIDEGSRLCVVDLDASVSRLHPGGTSSEFASVYALVRSLSENFKDVNKVQILINGQAAETLAGHVDLSSPVSKSDF